MKHNPMLNCGTVNFLADRRQAIGLTALPAAWSRGYVWHRIFLRGKGQKRDL
ncbi:MAG: hypothetical protein HY921_01660 [Elusimicrobia bacterium]|nr:hypothetical protein [Elusimicrobiota bacterium]